MREYAWVDMVRSAYRSDLTDEEWLDAAADVVRSRLDHGLGVYAHYYRAPSPHEYVPGPIRFYGCSDELKAFAHRAVFHDSTPEIVRQILLSHPFGTTSDALGRAVLSAALRPSAPPAGIADSMAINAVDPLGNGCVIMGPMTEMISIPPSERALWTRVTAHFSAGYRLRRELRAATLDDAAAVIDPRGRVQHATGAAAEASGRTALVQAVANVQRARKRGIAPLESLELWTALVAGTWSIVDRVDTDGRTFFVAWKNDPALPPLRSLTERESQIASYAALGHSNKLIAYSLGLGTSTVATHLTSAQAKLGVHGRVELIELVRTLRWSSSPPEVRELDVGALELASVEVIPRSNAFAILSEAERAIAHDVLRGRSDNEIARARGTSPRTVANQLRKIYERLGVRSRSELAALQ